MKGEWLLLTVNQTLQTLRCTVHSCDRRNPSVLFIIAVVWHIHGMVMVYQSVLSVCASNCSLASNYE